MILAPLILQEVYASTSNSTGHEPSIGDYGKFNLAVFPVEHVSQMTHCSWNVEPTPSPDHSPVKEYL